MMKLEHLRKAAVAALGFGLLAAAIPLGASAQDSAPITYFTFEGQDDDPLMTEYVAKFGGKPSVSIFESEDEAFAKMRAGYQPDVMAPCSYEFGRWQEAGLLQPIDVTKLTYWSKIAPTLKKIPGAMKSETEAWFVPQYWASTSVTFRTDLAPEYVGKGDWGILFDPKYKGKIAALDGVDDTVSLVAKQLGFDPYNLTPEQYEQVKAKLRELVANKRFIGSDLTQLAQGLASGEFVAAITWSDTYGMLRNEGKPVEFMKPASGVFNYVCGFVVHKDAKDWDRIYSLIDSGLTADAAKYYVNDRSIGSANAEAMAALPKEELDKAGLVADVDAFLAAGTLQIRMPNKETVIKDWENIQAGL
jgi:spermidine/putrescine transport system substrate-binding protein